MNWGHVNAVCKGSTVTVISVDGVRVATEGHIAFVVGAGFDEPRSPRTEYAPFLNAWCELSDVPVSPVTPGTLMGTERSIGRWVGEAYVAERFLRCFGLEAVTYTPQGGPKSAVLVHAGGALIGAIMPMTVRADEALPAREELTDQEVFGPYATEDNGYYNIDRKTLKKRLEDARRELRNALDVLDEAQETADECREAVSSLEVRLREMEREA